MADDKELDADTRRGLRILADSTKARGSEGAARRLYKAADTGRQTDYQQAEHMFDSLPPEKRSSIQVSAETKAETVRVTKSRRKPAPPPAPAPAPAEAMPWELPDPSSTEGIFRRVEPESQPKPKPKSSRPAAPADNSSQNWETGRIPGNPKMPRATAKPPAKPKPARVAAPVDDDAEGRSWDWQKLPDDPVLRAQRKKPKTQKSELAALREEMLRTLKD